MLPLLFKSLCFCGCFRLLLFYLSAGFILLCLLIQLARRPAGWSHWTCGKIFVAALVPFGPFLIEPWLKREDSRVRQAKGASRL